MKKITLPIPAEGHEAYRLHLLEPARIDDAVDIFSPGEQKSCVSVEQQYSFYQKWMTSLRDN